MRASPARDWHGEAGPSPRHINIRARTTQAVKTQRRRRAPIQKDTTPTLTRPKKTGKQPCSKIPGGVGGIGRLQLFNQDMGNTLAQNMGKAGGYPG